MKQLWAYVLCSAYGWAVWRGRSSHKIEDYTAICGPAQPSRGDWAGFRNTMAKRGITSMSTSCRACRASIAGARSGITTASATLCRACRVPPQRRYRASSAMAGRVSHHHGGKPVRASI